MLYHLHSQTGPNNDDPNVSLKKNIFISDVGDIFYNKTDIVVIHIGPDPEILWYRGLY